MGFRELQNGSGPMLETNSFRVWDFVGQLGQGVQGWQRRVHGFRPLLRCMSPCSLRFEATGATPTSLFPPARVQRSYYNKVRFRCLFIPFFTNCNVYFSLIFDLSLLLLWGEGEKEKEKNVLPDLGEGGEKRGCGAQEAQRWRACTMKMNLQQFRFAYSLPLCYLDAFELPLNCM